jgi:Spy/CpxP family protein refolding chaperone
MLSVLALIVIVAAAPSKAAVVAQTAPAISTNSNSPLQDAAYRHHRRHHRRHHIHH